MVREGYLENDVMSDIKTPKIPNRFPKVLSEEEVVILLRLTKKDTLHNAIFLFLLDTGVRASELCSLRIDDLSLGTLSARVFGKGAKERKVFYSPVTARALAKWLSVRPESYDRFLFIGKRGEPLTRCGLGNILLRLGRKAGIRERVNPHEIRHTFATLYVKAGGDAHTLQHLLGHSTLAMSLRYVDLVGKDLAEAHQRYSPVTRLQKG